MTLSDVISPRSHDVRDSTSPMAILGLAPSGIPVQPAHFDIERVIRPNILALKPYRCARDDYQEGVLLDANENALGPALVSSAISSIQDGDVRATAGLNLHRYPDPSHPQIKSRIAALRGLPGPDHVFLGVGSDEVIDLLIRVCVAPGSERILITPPTYGMYAVCAQVNDVGVTRIPLEASGEAGEGGEKGRFSVDIEGVSAASPSKPSCLNVCRSRKPSRPTRQSSSSSYALLETRPEP
jgi:histidinol-phosphate aminotransferase